MTSKCTNSQWCNTEAEICPHWCHSHPSLCSWPPTGQTGQTSPPEGCGSTHQHSGGRPNKLLNTN